MVENMVTPLNVTLFFSPQIPHNQSGTDAGHKESSRFDASSFDADKFHYFVQTAEREKVEVGRNRKQDSVILRFWEVLGDSSCPLLLLCVYQPPSNLCSIYIHG